MNGYSLSFRPGIPAGRGRKIHRTPDTLFHVSLTASGIFQNFQGRLDPNGEAVATVRLPSLPTLPGLRFFAAAVTVVNGQIARSAWSPIRSA